MLQLHWGHQSLQRRQRLRDTLVTAKITGRRGILTGADGGTIGEDGRVNWRAAGLDGAVAETVSKVRLRAVAGIVTGRASKFGVGNGEHVVDAGLTACWEPVEKLAMNTN